jgi:hypothetical protein
LGSSLAGARGGSVERDLRVFVLAGHEEGVVGRVLVGARVDRRAADVEPVRTEALLGLLRRA